MLTRTLLRLLAGLACLLCMAWTPLVAFGAEPVKIGVLAFRPKPQTLNEWQPLAQALKQAMPERDFVIEAFNLPDLELAVAARQLDFVLTNSGHYVLLKRRYDLSSPLATLQSEQNGQKVSVFGGVIFSRSDDARINELRDIRGKTVVAVSTDSAAGFQMQAYELSRVGIHVPQDVTLTTTGMPQDSAVEQVLNGRADVGFVRSGVLEGMAREGRLDMTRLKVINLQNLPAFPVMVSTRLYPEWPFVALPHIDEKLARHVTAALFMLDERPGGANLNKRSFAVPADYSPVEDMLRELRFPPFELAPSFTGQDVWARYRWWAVSGLLGVSIIAFLGLGLLLTNRRLSANRHIVMKQKEKLEESEKRFTLAIEGAEEGLWDLDLTTGHLYHSPRMWEMLGYAPGELPTTREAWNAITHPQDFIDCTARVKAHFKDANNEFRMIVRFRHHDGRWRWILSRGRASRDTNGRAVRFTGTHTDITERKQAEDDLQASEARFRQFFEKNSSVMLLMEPSNGNICDANDAAVSYYGYDKTTLVGMPINQINTLPPKVVAQEMLLALREERGYFNFIHRTASGELRDVEVRATPIESGGRPLMFSIVHDITQRKQAEEKLQLAASVFTHAREAIMITAANGTIIDVNDAFTHITGYSHAEVMGQNPRLLSSSRQHNDFYTLMWAELTANGHWYGEVWNRHKSGEVYAVMQTISTVYDTRGKLQHYVALFSDITVLKQYQSKLEHIAHYDALTNLPNRALLADRMHQGVAQAVRRGQKLAVAFLDLDGFKAINDRHGHDAGDHLLVALSERMRHALREGDTLARLGGDEFVAVLVDLEDVAACEPMLLRLLAAAAQPVEFGDNSLQVSASLGVTFYPQTQDVDSDQLLRQADQAMYQAKLGGKNRYHVFDAEQDRVMRGHHESVAHIRSALSQREFVLHYQPKVNMRTGQIIGAEALIRWQHPENGLLPPSAFLPVVEDHPLAIDIGEWVIDTALAQIEQWQAGGLSMPVSVNVGARQLQQTNFVERLRALLAAHPTVAPSSLELELLETSALEDVAGVSRLIEECRAIGVTFALDDFGTGYSSLTYLKRLPVTMLKIDQSFVRDMLDDPDDLAILQGVMGLASAFHRQVIAEGVETIAHGTLLLQLGCDLAQGYGIARPMPAAALPAWAATWTPDKAWSTLNRAEPATPVSA